MIARVIFWVAGALIAYTYLGYPALMYLRSRLYPKPWRQEPILPGVSIVMAVHNGASRVRPQVENLLALDYPEDLVEVIVVSDGSTDGTNEILRKMTHSRLRVVFSSEWQGKAAALNMGVRLATKEILLFVDLRPRIERDAVRTLVRNFADPKVGCVAGELHLQPEGKAQTRAVSSLYWRYEQWIRKSESATGSPTGVYGGFYAIRKSLAVALSPGLILDDMYQPLWAVRQGYRSVIDAEAKVWDTWPARSSAEFNRKVRTLSGNYQLFLLAPWLLRATNPLRWRLISHKVLRLAIPLLLVAVLVSSFILRASAFFLVVFALQSIFYLLALLGSMVSVPGLRTLTGPASAFCLVNAAALVAPFRFFRHKHDLWRTWSPTATADARISEKEGASDTLGCNGVLQGETVRRHAQAGSRQ